VLAGLPADALPGAAREARALGADLLELRLDLLPGPFDLEALVAALPPPLCVTCRSAGQGGAWNGAEEERQGLLQRAAELGSAWIDWEWQPGQHCPRRGAARVVASYHAGERSGPDALDLLAAMEASGPDLVKICTPVASFADNLDLVALHRRARLPLVAFGLGELGRPSRLLGPCFGAPLVFAHAGPEPVAPGLPSLAEVVASWQLQRCRAGTGALGLIGDPVSQSLGPSLHNAALAALGLDAVYLPFAVPSARLAEFLLAAPGLGLAGLSVTRPHKAAVLALPGVEAEATAREVGAANTLLWRGDRWLARNSDRPAILEVLREEGGGLGLRGSRGLVIGAGGAARAAAFALRDLGLAVLVTARRPQQAVDLARAVAGRAVAWEERGRVAAELVVQATPLGMVGAGGATLGSNEDILPGSALGPGTVALDLVYRPAETAFLASARAAGARTISGLRVFLAQAALQFEWFSGQAAPSEVFGRALAGTGGRP
jgi:3-dehydroquinate dehydratase/shikimate dehydrogenase